MLAASHAPRVGHLVNSVEHNISPIGIAAIALAVLALLAYVVLWVVSRNQRPSLAAILEPYRMTGGAGQEVPGPPPLITMPWLQRSPVGCKRRWVSRASDVGWRACSSERDHVCMLGSSSRSGLSAA